MFDFRNFFLQYFWIIYLGSLLSAVILGNGVLQDIKEMHLKMEKVIPFIKEELFQNLTMTMITTSNEKLQDMVNILGENNIFNTFIVIKNDEEIPSKKEELFNSEITDILINILNLEFNEEKYLIMPLGINRIGICLSLNENSQNKRYLLNITEKMREEVEKNFKYSITLGIGRTYKNLENLRISYNEAFNALEYASKIGKNNVVHIDDIQESNNLRFIYPFREREELLLSIKQGNTESALKILDKFLSNLLLATDNNLEVYKIRITELIGLIINAGISVGGDNTKLLNLNYYNNLINIREINKISFWLKTVVKEIIEIIINSHLDRSGSLVKKAITFIEKEL